MLKLTRRPYPDEVIYLQDQDTGKVLARVQVLNIRGSQAALGFDAPKNIKIQRGEIMSADEREAAEKQLKSGT